MIDDIRKVISRNGFHLAAANLAMGDVVRSQPAWALFESTGKFMAASGEVFAAPVFLKNRPELMTVGGVQLARVLK